MTAIVSAPPIKHFMNSIGITPAVYSPLDTRPVEKYKFAPGEVLVVPKMPNRPRDFSKAQLGNTNGFPYNKPDAMNLALAEKYNVFDPKQRAAAAAEIKLMAKLEADTHKLRKELTFQNQLEAMQQMREANAVEKVKEYKAWEQSAFPGNPMEATQKALADATMIRGMEELNRFKIQSNIARINKEVKQKVSLQPPVGFRRRPMPMIIGEKGEMSFPLNPRAQRPRYVEFPAVPTEVIERGRSQSVPPQRIAIAITTEGKAVPRLIGK
jgi:hypothetical protein